MHPTEQDPLMTLADAMHLHEQANLRLFLAMDYAASFYPHWASTMPTEVMTALDAAREAAARMWPFLTVPVTVVGPTQDQTPEQEIEQAYLNGELSEAERIACLEAIQATREDADNAVPTFTIEEIRAQSDVPVKMSPHSAVPQMSFYCRPQDIQF